MINSNLNSQNGATEYMLNSSDTISALFNSKTLKAKLNPELVDPSFNNNLLALKYRCNADNSLF